MDLKVGIPRPPCSGSTSRDLIGIFLFSLFVMHALLFEGSFRGETPQLLQLTCMAGKPTQEDVHFLGNFHDFRPARLLMRQTYYSTKGRQSHDGTSKSSPKQRPSRTKQEERPEKYSDVLFTADLVRRLRNGVFCEGLRYAPLLVPTKKG